jgi:hypothetical protein
MTTSGSFQALRRANPRAKAGFAGSVEATADAVRTRLAIDAGAPAPPTGHASLRRRLARGLAVGGALAAAAAVAAILVVAPPGAGPSVANAAAAVRKAATVTAAEAERSGTAVVRITHNDTAWAGSTIHWHGQDLSLTSDAPGRFGRAGSEFRVVGGTMYGIDDGDWVVLGSPDSIDPGSGTTPDEYLAAVREDVGGATLRRITDGMTDPTTRQLPDGATVYSGTAPAGLIARETGFKEGQSIRVLPFGYVAHDEAADPDAPLHAAITVGAGGIVREVAVTWGTGASAWTYTVTYSGLGETPAPVAPAGARPLRERLRAERTR